MLPKWNLSTLLKKKTYIREDGASLYHRGSIKVSLKLLEHRSNIFYQELSKGVTGIFAHGQFSLGQFAQIGPPKVSLR